MRKQNIKCSGTAERRRQIIQAALACFGEMGFVNTTMEDIRIRSKASNGSIYHHFKSKDQLAAAVYIEGIIDYQAGLIDELKKHPQAREGIYEIVRYHMQWVSEHVEWSRYLFQMRHAGFMTDTEDSIKAENKRFSREFWAYFSRHIEDGTLRSLPVELYISLILGPCQELYRIRLSRPVAAELNTAVVEIAEAAWQALRVKKMIND
ncbi:MAG: TetR/AcrR family transcriptional regulator [Desulfocucumaceae bacterium]